MNDFFKEDDSQSVTQPINTNDQKISHIDEFSPYVKVIKDLTEQEIEAIRETGNLVEHDDDAIKSALSYFVTIMEEDPKFPSYGYITANQEFKNSPYLDYDNNKTLINMLNRGTIRQLYQTTLFTDALEYEYSAHTVELSKQILYDLSDDIENKDVLASLKALTAIAKQNEEKLKDNRDTIILYMPDEEFYNSYCLAMKLLNTYLIDVKRSNPVGANMIIKELYEDSFFKNENVQACLALSNLQHP